FAETLALLQGLILNPRIETRKRQSLLRSINELLDLLGVREDSFLVEFLLMLPFDFGKVIALCSYSRHILRTEIVGIRLGGLMGVVQSLDFFCERIHPLR